MKNLNRKSYRLSGWDYSSDGHYFVTICTKNKEHYFGKIIDGEMRLRALGEIAQQCWLEIPKHFNNTELDEFIIMPNHIHGIIILKNCRDEALPRPYDMHRMSPKPKSLPVIVGSFKSIVTKTINQRYPQSNFAWQPRFYDRIIRNDKEWYFIQEYIMSNPINWENDLRPCKIII